MVTGAVVVKGPLGFGAGGEEGADVRAGRVGQASELRR
jgi:hypothetical protein